jgi:hypothetical protein
MIDHIDAELGKSLREPGPVLLPNMLRQGQQDEQARHRDAVPYAFANRNSFAALLKQMSARTSSESGT